MSRLRFVAVVNRGTPQSRDSQGKVLLLISLLAQEQHSMTRPAPLEVDVAKKRYGHPTSCRTQELTAHRTDQRLERGRSPLRLKMSIMARMEVFQIMVVAVEGTEIRRAPKSRVLRESGTGSRGRRNASEE